MHRQTFKHTSLLVLIHANIILKANNCLQLTVATISKTNKNMNATYFIYILTYILIIHYNIFHFSFSYLPFSFHSIPFVALLQIYLFFIFSVFFFFFFTFLISIWITNIDKCEDCQIRHECGIFPLYAKTIQHISKCSSIVWKKDSIIYTFFF